jgi:hypothetical protein
MTSKARNLADVISGNFDIPLSALDNVPPSNNASALTTGTLPVARIADGSLAAAKLASGAAVGSLGYTPALYAYSNFNATTSGNVWCRCAYFQNSRVGYLVTINTDGGWYSPTSHSFILYKDWTNSLYVTNLGKPAGTFASAVRMQGAAGDGPWFLEVLFAVNANQTTNAFRMGIMALTHTDLSFLPQIGSYGTNAPNLASTSASVGI